MKRGLVVCLALAALGCGEREDSGEQASGTFSRTADATSAVTVASVTRGLDAISGPTNRNRRVRRPATWMAWA